MWAIRGTAIDCGKGDADGGVEGESEESGNQQMACDSSGNLDPMHEWIILYIWDILGDNKVNSQL